MHLDHLAGVLVLQLRALLQVDEGSHAVQHLQQGHVLQLQVQVQSLQHC